jgi:pyridoxal 5'-phosphate synthase pdxS subunit
VARSADPGLVRQIMDAVSIPVMAKVRIGHTAEARILEYLGVDFIDESEVLTPADTVYHIDKWQFKVPFVRHMRALMSEIRKVQSMPEDELPVEAKELRVSLDLLRAVRTAGRLPVVNFSAGGIATPADAALMMMLGADGVFVGSGIFKSPDPAERAKAIVAATTYWDDPKVLADVSSGLKEGMTGTDTRTLGDIDRMQVRDS